jgi:hypothetical protein
VRIGLAWPAGLTIALLAARAAAAPPLTDPVGTALPAGLQLAYPWLYLILAPLFGLWDGVSMLSLTRLRGFLVGLAVLYAAWRITRGVWRGQVWTDGPTVRRPIRRELVTFAVALAGLVAFIVAGTLWHRPMARLAGAAPGMVAFDMHTHTNVSHDVRGTLMRGFDPEAARRWHGRAGFDAFFITDHNTVEGLTHVPGRPVACPGIEVSAWRAHVVLLGDTLRVDRSRYGGSLGGLRALLRESDSAYGALSVLSLPEYERYHRDGLDSLLAAGADGLEIVNASPAANEMPRPRRDSVIALARGSGRFVVGASDSHGWGATSMVWNVMALPAPPPDGDALCRALVDGLRAGFGSSRVVERHRLRADSAWPAWLTPVGVVWETWRGMNGALTVAWLVWIWLLWGIRRRRYTW